MNDLQQLTLTLEHLGIEYKLEPRGSDPYLDEEYGESTITQSVTIGNGVGYSFFTTNSTSIRMVSLLLMELGNDSLDYRYCRDYFLGVRIIRLRYR